MKTKSAAALSVALSALALAALPGPAARAADAQPAIGLKFVADGYVSPLALVPFEDRTGRVLIMDQIGIVNLVAKDGTKLFFDLRPKLVKLNDGAFDERGLLGLALHPQFNQNRKLYAYYSAPLRKGAPEGWDHTSRVGEFKASEDFTSVDPASERLVLEIDEPQANHNCGRILFGPDGFLYIGVGDGGAGNDQALGHSPQGNGQDTTTLLGKILRIDVDKGTPYAIPSDNPFVKTEGIKPEIYAYGFRNPWGLSFDRGGAREFFAAEVGQGSFEEINIVVKGGNYGWRLREAFIAFDPKNPLNPPAEIPKTGLRGEPLLDPILAYKNSGRWKNDPEVRGISVTGGYVYRGQAIPQLRGRYVFADWSLQWGKPDGVLYVATRPAAGAKEWKMDPLELSTHPGGRVGAYLVALGENADGELYVLTNDSNALKGKTGRVWKIVPM